MCERVRLRRNSDPRPKAAAVREAAFREAAFREAALHEVALHEVALHDVALRAAAPSGARQMAPLLFEESPAGAIESLLQRLPLIRVERAQA